MATIKDIARLARVTPSTVSRVLNHSGGYSEKTRHRVEQIAKELHYQKNEAAFNLVAQSSNLGNRNQCHNELCRTYHRQY